MTNIIGNIHSKTLVRQINIWNNFTNIIFLQILFLEMPFLSTSEITDPLG